MHQKNIGNYSSVQAWTNSALHRMQYPKCVEKLAVHYLTNEFAENLCLVTPSRRTSARRTRIRKMNEVKDAYYNTFAGGMPCKKIEFSQSGRGSAQYSNANNYQTKKRMSGRSSIGLKSERIKH